ncbi:MAG: hypothetical protein KIT09_34885 [Bryobacteraceae bacterium]|nr:hypothetical protein [Bryobacteraceae bacterium]
MPSHQPLSVVARTLQTDESTLLEFSRNSWIHIVERQSQLYLDAHQQYKARYILHLRNGRKLTDHQIGVVLGRQKPPYSAQQVDEILAQESVAEAPEPIPVRRKARS